MSNCRETAITFGSKSEQLFGILHEPERALDVAIVILVGGPQYRVGSHRMFVQIARDLASCGYSVLRFDFRGMGDSHGAFAGFEKLDSCVRTALDHLCATRPSIARVVLLGLCDGATAAAYYAANDQRVSGVVLLNPWVHSSTTEAKAYLWHYYPRRLLQRDFWRSLLAGKVALAASIGDLGRKLSRALSSRRSTGVAPGSFVDRMRDALQRFRGRVLVVASENDLTASEFTDLWTGDAAWRGVREAARFVPLAGADHTLSSADELRRFVGIVRDWLGEGVVR